jgi:hypothetical protein
MDFFIVILGWLSLIDGFPNFKSFRGFRALRAIKGIRVLSYCSAVMDALFEASPSCMHLPSPILRSWALTRSRSQAVPLFVDVFLVTIFCIIIFGIMGVQSFAGAYMRRCEWLATPNTTTGMAIVYEGNGNELSPELYCGSDLYGNSYAPQPGLASSGLTCPRGTFCNKGENPNDGWTAFDNIIIASFTLFQMMTLEGAAPCGPAALLLIPCSCGQAGPTSCTRPRARRLPLPRGTL